MLRSNGSPITREMCGCRLCNGNALLMSEDLIQDTFITKGSSKGALFSGWGGWGIGVILYTTAFKIYN